MAKIMGPGGRLGNGAGKGNPYLRLASEMGPSLAMIDRPRLSQNFRKILTDPRVSKMGPFCQGALSPPILQRPLIYP